MKLLSGRRWQKTKLLDVIQAVSESYGEISRGAAESGVKDTASRVTGSQERRSVDVETRKAVGTGWHWPRSGSTGHSKLTVRCVKGIYGNIRRSAKALAASDPVIAQELTGQ